jgi:hypothetical protein
MEQVGPFGVVELQGAGDGVEHGCADPGQGAALELGVVLDADAGQGGDLAAAQSGHASGADVREPDVDGCQLGAPGGEELAHLGPVVHVSHGTGAEVRLRPRWGALSVHVTTGTPTCLTTPLPWRK